MESSASTASFGSPSPNAPTSEGAPSPYRLLDGISTRLAEHVASTRFEQLPTGAVRAFRRALLDYLTCTISGASMPVSAALRQYFEENDFCRHSAVIGHPTRLSAANAALLNGSHAHGLDFDDGYTQGSAHPAGAIFPAALAAAERHGSTPRDIVTAVVVGYEVMLRIAAAMHPASARKGWHNTSVAGVFGAAAAVASLLRLDPAGTRNALGLAGSFAGGIREYLAEGAEIKRIHPGKAARDGLMCAEFAKRGVTGPARVLEGDMGLLRLVSGDQIRPEHLLAPWGERYAIMEGYFKPYPCCRHFHAAIDAVRALHSSHGIRPADVVAVQIGLYAVGALGHDHQTADSLLEAQMSAPCAIALAILDQDVTATSFLPGSLGRPDVQLLMRKATVHVDAACEDAYPRIRSGVVRITLASGQMLEQRTVGPKGESDNPMSDEDLERKFFSNCGPLLPGGKAARLVEATKTFDQVADASELYEW